MPTMDGSDPTTCGICFFDDDNSGKAIRGKIDSCDHYFCFVCILEWAKVESRCPLCKRRFTSIRRPPVHGVFVSERIVSVPERNQAYWLGQNTTIGPFDPFAQVKCSVCHGTEDESLLLLCELCDCASHTYCVGLGATVPEGDWYCHDCDVSRTEHDNIQKDDHAVVGDGQNSYPSPIVELQAETSVSITNDTYQENTLENSISPEASGNDVLIFDVVHEDDPLDRVKRARYSTPSVAYDGQTGLADEQIADCERTPSRGKGTSKRVDIAAAAEARTLSRCRNVHYYIRALRENWNDLQSGSLRFSSRSMEPCGNKVILPGTSSKPHCSTSKGDQKSATQDGSPHDVDKAWKMMERAKVMKKTPEKNKNTHSSLKYSTGERSSSNQATNRSFSLCQHTSRQFCGKELTNHVREKSCKQYDYGKEDSKCVLQKLEKQKWKEATQETEKAHDCSTSACSLGFFASLSSSKRPLDRKLHGASSNDPHKPNVAEREIVLSGTRQKANNTKYEFSTSSFNKVNIPNGTTIQDRDSAERKMRKDDDPKSEIQSLVKLNLKRLSRDKQLGVDSFKEVARQATHTILAACGLGHSRHVLRSCPSPTCNHSEQIKQLRKSSLLPNSCRECFFIFVKDVVNSILLKKACRQNH